ncbi:MAG: DUF6263 family protein [Bacteroidota bacterium]|nr:DUF6263 family protein [Bacteroidota bacterium]
MTLHAMIRLLFYPLLVFSISCGRSPQRAGGGTDSSTVGDSSSVGGLVWTGDTVRLVMRFAKGETFGYEITEKQRVEMARDSAVEKSAQTLSHAYRFEVLDVRPDGSARLRATCLHVRLDGDYSEPGGRKVMHYDSREKNEPAKEKMFARFNAPVNTPFEIVLTPEGRVSAVRAPDEIARRLLRDDYTKVSKEARDKIATSYTEDDLKGTIQKAFQKVEDKAVGVDSSWKHVWTGSIGYLKIRNEATYVLQGFRETPQGRIASIGGTLVSTYIGPDVLDTGQGNATVHEFRVEGTATTAFSLREGKPLSRSLVQKLSTRFYVEPPPELKQIAPDQAKNFWWTQRAVIENTIERLSF